ncbi:MAG: phosphoglucosamine mutase [Huintestinicola sp.]|uniref:phosphoglucosamine mutase n=1 Tax=Huintestinicola sp. TaxID=2981661 RepID=UPI003F0B1073
MSISLGPEGDFFALSGDISCEAALRLGRAAADVLCGKNGGRLLVGRDTRRSSRAYEAALTAGILSAGKDVTSLGVIPQPAGAYLVKKIGADGFIMTGDPDKGRGYCGFSIYGSDGRRISEDISEKINEKLCTHSEKTEAFGSISEIDDVISEYIGHILRNCGSELSGMTVAADCANGAVFAAAEKLFSALGAKVYLLNCDPDGDNINKDCGISHMETLAEFVRNKKCDLGLAFDGFGAKCLAVDEKGVTADGEKLLAVFAKDMRERGVLANNSAVVSASANLGFSVFAEETGIRPVVTKAGGKYITEKMLAGGFSLGGEQSGNILFGDISPESDGLLTAVLLLSAVKRSGKTLGQLCSVMERYPQVAINVKISDRWREVWKNIPELEELIEKKERELGDFGRIIVRENPTEPVIRVSVEGRRFDAVNSMALEIAEAVKRLCPVH